MKYKFTLTSNPNQSVLLVAGGLNVELALRWNEETQCWVYSVFRSNAPLLSGRQLRVGVNLLRNIPFVGTLTLLGDAPTRNNLGQDNELIYEV